MNGCISGKAVPELGNRQSSGDPQGRRPGGGSKGFSIRPTRVTDVPDLPAIERSAGKLFRTIPDLAWVAEGEDLPVEVHLQFSAAGTSWVAEDCSGPLIAFLCSEVMGNALHIWELAVALHRQRSGTGRALLNEAISFARRQRLDFVTLTTFRLVPWNEPAYQKMGFVTLRPEECSDSLVELLEREAAAGQPRSQRCAMQLAIAAVSSQ